MASTSPTNEPKKSRFRLGSSGGATKADGASSTRGEAKEPGRSAQFRQVFETARANDPALLAWMIGAFALVFVLLLIIGFSIGHPIYLGIIGVLLGVLAALLVLARRANTAIYKSISGQPGASVAVMSSLRKGWFVEQEPVGVDMGRNRQVRDLSGAAMVYRAVGKPGVVLVAEGPKGMAERLLSSENKRTTRVLGPEVPVHTLRVGTDEGSVPVERLQKDMQKMPKVLTDDEAARITKRLRALGSGRPAAPAGIDPTKARVNRAAMRGR